MTVSHSDAHWLTSVEHYSLREGDLGMQQMAAESSFITLLYVEFFCKWLLRIFCIIFIKENWRCVSTARQFLKNHNYQKYTQSFSSFGV